MKSTLEPEDKKRINKALKRFREERTRFEWLAKNVFALLAEHPELRPLIHSVKWRVKDESHLRHKLIRKTFLPPKPGELNDEPITADNLFERIEDLAGVRLLHLHTNQFKPINKSVSEILQAQQWIVKGPEANIWDDEYRGFFEKMGVKTISRGSLYTSVHYILQPNSIAPHKCELQVRTLAEEIWGEVSHTIDYPEETKSIACKEQLKVLARLTSSCIRLVDAVFESQHEHKALTKVSRKTTPTS
jgi:ppGpp synthetase/RelA/SpoT-type nucleotidyltranferase